MNKAETARQFARQTAEQQHSAESLPREAVQQQMLAEKEMLNLFQATARILERVSHMEQRQAAQEERLNRIQAQHRREIRRLMIAFALPLLLSLIALTLLIALR